MKKIEISSNIVVIVKMHLAFISIVLIGLGLGVKSLQINDIIVKVKVLIYRAKIENILVLV